MPKSKGKRGRDDDAWVGLGEALQALEESVKLQSHYAALLNQYDGGERRSFRDGMDWINRLRECRKLGTVKAVPGDQG